MPVWGTVTNPERAAWWKAAIGTDRVQLESCSPHLGKLPELGEALVYKLKLSALSTGQLMSLAEALAAKFALPRTDVLVDLLGPHGVPILAEDVVVSTAEL